MKDGKKEGREGGREEGRERGRKRVCHFGNDEWKCLSLGRKSYQPPDPSTLSYMLATVVPLVYAWGKAKGGLRSCGGWCMGFQVRVLAEGWLEGEGGSLGNASSGQSRTVGARVAGPFVWIIQCDTRERKAD